MCKHCVGVSPTQVSPIPENEISLAFLQTGNRFLRYATDHGVTVIANSGWSGLVVSMWMVRASAILGFTENVTSTDSWEFKATGRPPVISMPQQASVPIRSMRCKPIFLTAHESSTIADEAGDDGTASRSGVA